MLCILSSNISSVGPYVKFRGIQSRAEDPGRGVDHEALECRGDAVWGGAMHLSSMGGLGAMYIFLILPCT